MNRHQEIWINGVEYDLIHIYRTGGYREVILLNLDTEKIADRVVIVENAVDIK